MIENPNFAVEPLRSATIEAVMPFLLEMSRMMARLDGVPLSDVSIRRTMNRQIATIDYLTLVGEDALVALILDADAVRPLGISKMVPALPLTTMAKGE